MFNKILNKFNIHYSIDTAREDNVKKIARIFLDYEIIKFDKDQLKANYICKLN